MLLRVFCIRLPLLAVLVQLSLFQMGLGRRRREYIQKDSDKYKWNWEVFVKQSPILRYFFQLTQIKGKYGTNKIKSQTALSHKNIFDAFSCRLCNTIFCHLKRENSSVPLKLYTIHFGAEVLETISCIWYWPFRMIIRAKYPHWNQIYQPLVQKC